MAAELGADSLLYLPLEAVARCIGLPADRLCRACITGEYPTPTGEQLYQIEALKTTRPTATARWVTRAYEVAATAAVSTGA